MSKFFSIIVPAYNAEKYIEQCIYSILQQSYVDFEIVIIDDGSSDKTAQICRMFEHKDDRIHYIHQENKGVSAARNLGIDVAKGEYILFVDSDDYIKLNTLEKLFEKCRDGCIDLCFFGYQYVVNGSIKKYVYPLKYYGGKNTDILFELIEQNVFGLACNKAIRRVFLKQNKLDFNREIRVFEDQDFMMRAWNKATVICCIPETLYYYVNSSTSAMHLFQSVQSERFFSTHDKNLKKLKQFMIQNGIKIEQLDRFLLRYVDAEIGNIVRMAGSISSKEYCRFAEQLERSELIKTFRDVYPKAEQLSIKEKIFWLISKPSMVFLMRWLGIVFENKTHRR